MPALRRRFWLPAIAMLFSGLLMWLESILHAQIVNLTNDVLNLPASIAYHYINIDLGGGNYLSPFQNWVDRGLYFGLVGLCWYLVGIELDFHMLQSIAARGRTFRVAWIMIGAGLQGLVIWLVYLFVIELSLQKPREHFDLIAIPYCFILLSWFQLTALRFWKSRQPSIEY